MYQNTENISDSRPESSKNDLIAVKKRGVLLVEDYEPNTIMMTMLFELMGYECDVARNGFEALDKFFMSRYDLVLMDLQLPDIDGFETSRRMRLWEAGNGLEPTPILAASGNSSEEDKMFCLKAGMNDFLVKPLDMKELEEKLVQWLPPRGN